MTERMEVGNGNFVVPMQPYTSGTLLEHIRAENPELAAVARAMSGEETAIASGTKKVIVSASYVDPEFLDVFSLPIQQALNNVYGQQANPLRTARSAVLTTEAAQRLFGSSEQALGRELLLPYDQTGTVTGVLGAIPQPSHMGSSTLAPLRFDVLVSMDVLRAQALLDRGRNIILNDWGQLKFYTYALLPADGSLSSDGFRNRLIDLGKRSAPQSIANYSFDAIPISQLRLARLDILLGTEKTGLSSATTLFILGTLVLLVACLNYANLATARATTQTKEVAMRRTVGATRAQIASQYFFEAALLTLIALLVSISLLGAILPTLPLAGLSNVILASVKSPTLWVALLVLLAMMTLTSGAYPAFVLSTVQPAQAMRTGKSKSGPHFVPAVLTTAQFGAASFLLIAILVMSAQQQSIERLAMQSESDPVIVLSNSLLSANVSLDVLRNELARQPHIKSVSASEFRPYTQSGCNQEMIAASDAPGAASWPVCRNDTAHDFFATYQIKLLAGRYFDRDHAADVMPSMDAEWAANPKPNVIIDRKLAEQNGWTPDEAINQDLRMVNWTHPDQLPIKLRVVGVVEDHPLDVLGLGATSALFHLRPPRALTPSIRVDRTDIPAAIRELESVWNRLAPRVALRWQFADQMLNDTQRTFGMVTTLFGTIGVLALLVSVLGLIGMSTHVIRRRLHEIGIRKTLGANVRQVLTLLLADFSKPVLIANVIAWPIALIVMQAYLSLFTQRISLSVVPFAASLLATIVIALLAVSVQVTRAARLNPATVLRYE